MPLPAHVVLNKFNESLVRLGLAIGVQRWVRSPGRDASYCRYRRNDPRFVVDVHIMSVPFWEFDEITPIVKKLESLIRTSMADEAYSPEFIPVFLVRPNGDITRIFE